MQDHWCYLCYLYTYVILHICSSSAVNSVQKCDRITPVLASLHWLPFFFRINFKILLITFKARRGLAPPYISDLLSPYEPGHRLRSSGRELLAIPRSRMKTKGNRSFAIRAPRLWHNLPENIRLAESVPHFISLLKTHFYKKAFTGLCFCCSLFFLFCFVYFTLFYVFCIDLWSTLLPVLKSAIQISVPTLTSLFITYFYFTLIFYCTI